MAAYFPNLTRENLSLYAVPAMWVISIAPRFYTTFAYKSATNKSYDSVEPREFTKKLTTEVGLDAGTAGRIRRAEAAQANGFENFGLFAAAIAAGNAAGLSPTYLNTAAFAYLAQRTLYNVFYIFGDNSQLSTARSLTYISSIALLSSVFISAGNKLRKPLLI